MIVHCNLGDVIRNRDLSSVSAVEWAVDLLKVCVFLLERYGKGAKIRRGLCPDADGLA
jgi:carbonic anhydrase